MVRGGERGEGVEEEGGKRATAMAIGDAWRSCRESFLSESGDAR